GGEGLGAGVEMGLEHGEQARWIEFPQRTEGGADLGRVVGVVVVYEDRSAPALALQPAADAGEVGELRRRGLEVEPDELDRGQRPRAFSRLWRPGTASSSSIGPGASGPKPTIRAVPSPVSSSSEPSAGSTAPPAGARKCRKAACSSASDPQRLWWSI